MYQDDISMVVRSEKEIVSLGESLYNARKPQERRNDYIRQKMREMARLLITVRSITPLKTSQDLVMPSNFFPISYGQSELLLVMSWRSTRTKLHRWH